MGILPIGIIIKARRIIYLHYLLTLDKTEMLFKFFLIQWNNPTRGDWTELVKADLDDFKIEKNLEDIKLKSKLSFKEHVKERAKEHALEVLNDMKDGHSKMSNLHYTEIKTQEYLQSPNIRMEEALNLFKFRTHMADFGENYRAGAEFVLCPLCSKDGDSIKELDIR